MSKLDIPESWVELTLGDVSDFKNGRAFKSTEWAKTGLPIIRIQNVNADDPSETEFNYFQGEYDKNILVEYDDLLFCWSGSLGTSFGPRIWKGPTGVLNQHIFKVLLKNGIEKRFYFYQMKANIHLVEQRAHGGVGLTHITKSELVQVPFAIPPLDEQNRIVVKIEAVLDKVSNIESLLAKAEDLILKYQNALLQKVFRGELVSQYSEDEPASHLLQRIQNDRNKNSDGKKRKRDDLPPIKQEDIPFDIPKSWKWVRLADLCDSRGITYGVIKLGEHTPNGVPCLRTSDVRPGYIDLSGPKLIAKALSDEYSRTILRGGELLVNVRGTLGGVAVVPDHCKGFNVSREVAVVPLLDSISNLWIQNWILSPIGSACLFGYVRGGVYKGINLEDLDQLLVPLPPKEEALRAISELQVRLNSATTSIDFVKQIKSHCSLLFSSVLSSAVTGRLVPQIPTEGTPHQLFQKITEVDLREQGELTSELTMKAKGKSKRKTK
ncbi:MAG: restriction endonuclease subunit S [Bdellovibrionales bacterium]|nr:restriction endonuclease subunit S [Bdellovibrionales bacterium]